MAADLRDAMLRTAQSLGISPLDLATAISYETAGTFDPLKRGPTTKWGQHRGLIQFGEPQARQYGVNWDDPVGSQLGEDGAVARYLRDAGVQPGMGLLDVYSAINAGRVGRYNASDAAAGGAPGTVRDKVEQQMHGHKQKAAQLLGMNPGDPAPAMAPAREVVDRPVAAATPAPAAPPAPAPVQAPTEQGGLGPLMASLAPAAASMGGGGGAAAPQASFGSGDPMAATMAALQGSESARALRSALLPDVERLMGLGKRVG